MTFKKFVSLNLVAMMLIIAFSSFGLLASAASADLSLAPVTEAEMETAVLNAYKEAIKQRKNETKNGRWAETSFKVSLDFKNFTDPKYRVVDNAITDASYIFTLEIFAVLGNMRELDYEFLILKGGEHDGTNTFQISFDGISVTVRNQEILKMDVTYTLTWGETKEESERVKKFCDEVVKERITSDMTDEEKIKTLHDYVVSDFQYATEELENKDPSIYYPIYMIENGKGVCQAYTALFNRLMESAGMGDKELAVRHDSFADNGSGRIGHAWNMVNIDGKWYHIDTTWDDTGRSVRYNYYLKSDKSFEKDHFWRENFYPKADADYTKEQNNSSAVTSKPVSSEVTSTPTSSTVTSTVTSSEVTSVPASSTVTSKPSSSESSKVDSSLPTSSGLPSEPASSTVSAPDSSATSSTVSAPDSSATSKPESLPSSEPQSSETESDELNCSGLPSWNSSDITSENTSSVTEAEGFTLGFTETAVVSLAAVLMVAVIVLILKRRK